MSGLNDSKSTTRTIAVAVVGVGLVGAEFLHQLQAFPPPHPFRLVGLASSTASLFDPAGLPLTSSNPTWDWRAALSAARTPPDLPALTRALAALVRPGEDAVLVDNTAAEGIARAYPALLRAGVHVVTPNKRAFAGPQDAYDALLSAALEGGARCLHEATVGAGLPVVGTLKDLVGTGDEVKKVEGVLSGTLSYIFNEFSRPGVEGGPAFSEVVRAAREKGYTEPHPAEDLAGADVARKLTILARLIPSLRSALPEGHLSVPTISLVPPALQGSALPSTGEAFLDALVAHDEYYAGLRADAARAGTVLRYVGVIDVEKGTTRASLERYPSTHAFATSLGGADNIIMFHTARYGARPLIVQGAGAGAAVTAMGVLSDLLRLV
ncbi:aspartate kinase homoserine dehydrogenase [Gloeopeniophorella convolvens]|nr:aspartate kinase homoserine dehydrogenase [Gloeopeniophorella convolvens]